MPALARPSLPLALLLAAALGACRGGGVEPKPTPPDAGPVEASAPFAPHLPGKVQLLADRLEIGGPPELLDHLAVLQAEDRIQSSSEVRPDGLFSLHRVLEPGLDSAQAQLDGWELSAFQTLEILLAEPGRSLTVIATGGVRFISPTSGEDLYAERLEFELDSRGRLWRSLNGGARAQDALLR